MKEWKWKSKVKPGKKGGGMVGWRCSNFCLCVSLYKTILIGNKWNSFSLSRACFASDSNWWSIFLSSSQPMSFFNLFSPPVPLRRGSERAAGWPFGYLPKLTHHPFLKGSTCGQLCQYHHLFSGPSAEQNWSPSVRKDVCQQQTCIQLSTKGIISFFFF